jgi:hypothetical protein
MRARSLPTLVQVTRVLALMVSEAGLKEPPPPAMVMLAVPVGTQLGCGLGEGLGEVPGLGEGLGLGEVPGLGEGLGDVLGPGEGLGDGLALGEGLGLGPWASVAVAPTLRKIRPMAMTTHWIQSGRFICRVCGELPAGIA